jgi:hypothetical protein
MDDLEFYRQVNEIEALVKKIHRVLIDTLIDHLPTGQSLDYQGSVVLSVAHNFNKSIEMVLGQMGVVDARFVDAETVKKAEEVVKLEKEFYTSEPTNGAS